MRWGPMRSRTNPASSSVGFTTPLGFVCCWVTMAMGGMAAAQPPSQSATRAHSSTLPVPCYTVIPDATCALDTLDQLDEGPDPGSVVCQAPRYAHAGHMSNGSAAGALVWAGEDNKYGCRPSQPDTERAFEPILVVDRGECVFSKKAKMAQEAGYVGIVIVNGPGQSMVAPSFEDDRTVSIPAVMVDSSERERLRGPFTITYEVLPRNAARPRVAAAGQLASTPNRRADELVCLEAALEADPTYADAHYHMANHLHKARRVNEAFAAYSKAVELSPDHLGAHTNFPTLLYKYDIEGVGLRQKEELFQKLRLRAQDLVVEELSRGESQGEPAAVATPAGAGRAEYRLVRNVSREVASEAVCGGDATMEYVFDPEVRGQVYGTQSGPSRYTPPYKSGTSSAAPDGGAPRLPLNPPDLDEYNHMMYAEKATVVLKFNQASIEGQNGVVVKCDSTDSTNSTDTSTRRGESGQVFVPSPQSMVPLHSLLAMGPVYAGRLSSAVSVVQMSCDNYYHWTMECLPRLIVSLEFLKNNTVDTRGMTILLPMVKTKFITQSLKLLGLIKTKTPVEGAPFDGMGMKTKRHNPEAPLLVEELMTVDWIQTDGRPGLELTPARTALDRVRRTLAWPPLEGSARRALVFISRNSDHLSGDKSRAMTNEVEVLELLAQAATSSDLELKVFHGDQHDQASTIALFKSARVVIGAHGAGLANIVYCAPGTSVMEIAMQTPRHRDYMHAAASLGHGYWVHSEVLSNALESEITVDARALAAAVPLMAGGEDHSDSGEL